MDVAYSLYLLIGKILVGLVLISFLISIIGIKLFVYSFAFIFSFLGIPALVLWFFTGRENILKDKILRKGLKYITHVYVFLFLIALSPHLIYPSFEGFLITLITCTAGYISIIIDTIILYYLYIKFKNIILR
jgi:hypothetical protein